MKANAKSVKAAARGNEGGIRATAAARRKTAEGMPAETHTTRMDKLFSVLQLAASAVLLLCTAGAIAGYALRGTAGMQAYAVLTLFLAMAAALVRLSWNEYKEDR